MINYIIQVILFQGLFILFYDLFLSKETFFKQNRGYLIITLLLSFFIPKIDFSVVSNEIVKNYIIQLPEIVLSPQGVIEKTFWYDSLYNFKILFVIGASISFVIFTLKLIQISRLILSNRIKKESEYNLVFLNNGLRAFSFFKYIFISEKIEGFKKEQIIKHELIHVKQNHSIDLLIIEVLQVLMWFNPLLLIYKQRVMVLHEYIADANVVEETGRVNYINNLLSEVFQVECIPFINQFYKHSLIKKRIIMIKKKQSKKVNNFKYLLIFPTLVAMILYASISTAKADDETAENILMKIINERNKEKEVEKTQRVTNSVTPKVAPYKLVHKGPIFPGCYEDATKACFNSKMSDFIAKNFDMNSLRSLSTDLPPGKKRIYAIFKIATTGKIIDIETRAPNKKLRDYTRRVIEKLPNITPGENELGEKVIVGYTLPITFSIEK